MNSKIKLLPHNQKLYDEIKQYIDAGERSIFYSEATGLGKSFIFMRLVEEYFSGKRILYVVPKIAIWENLVHYDEFSTLSAEIEMMTFTAFNVYNSDDRLFEKYDAVFVDECHHMLSDIQGMNVAIFLEDMCNNNKFSFGLTATPKYGDIYVDEMYFNVSCYGYDVFEAVKYGLYPKIDIAIADINFNEIPKDLQKKFSVTGTKSLLQQITEERADITHWLAYFGNRVDLEQSEHELRVLFPEYKIIKLYQGLGNPDEIIKYFEEYNGKIILMSISMLLEGMHLDNVGGVLLYRNVGRVNTYFQIYGRLCKMGAAKSPLMVDVTNSILSISDFSVFKSSRYKNDKKYSRRDLFDVTSKTYRYIELLDALEQFKIKEYRGIRWQSSASLDKALGLTRGSVSEYIKKHDITEEEYIDYKLGTNTYDEYVANGYKEVRKCTINGAEYLYTSFLDLCRQVGRPYSSSSAYGDDASVDSYIKLVEWEHDHGFIIGGYYRDIDITSLTSVSKAIKFKTLNIKLFIEIENISINRYIDIWLDNEEYKGIKLLSGIEQLSEVTGISAGGIKFMFKKLHSIKDTIDYYLPDDKVYKGFKINDRNIIKLIAEASGVSINTVRNYYSGCGHTIEECIDYYVHGIKSKGVTPSTRDKRLAPSKKKYSNEEDSIILTMKDEGHNWREITDRLNALSSNQVRGIVRTASGIYVRYKAISKTEITDNIYEDQEYELAEKLRADGASWKEVADEVNKLECNVLRGVTRTPNGISSSYNNRKRKEIN